MNNHRGGICQHPVDMEAQTISGIKSNHTKNTFFSYNHIVGLVCLNSEQTKRLCEDYKVMFTCTGGFCSDCRTDWFDIDDPSGNGDYELLSELLALSPREVCASPLAMEAQTLSGTPASLTGDIFQVYDATYGFACVNADQSSGKCKDYRVRFTCPAEFCSVSQECRTGWFNSDNPSGIGDVESLSQLLQTYPDRICHNPISIFVKTVAGISAEHTGDKFLTNDVTFGFACINADQRKRSKMCEDYQVMFACPSDFCQGCKTRWFDFDNPDGNGDFERLSQLQSDFPDEICSEPLGIEAVTVSGTPALQTKNVFQV
ncbi:CILP1 protein, partial [Amia calva]|nr:CILP1 protein [Amia calva]